MQGGSVLDAGEPAAANLVDVSRSGNDATQAERNKLARAMFNSVVINKVKAVAIAPRPDLHPFFAVNPLLRYCNGGSDGIRSCHRTTRPDTVLVALPPTRRRVGASGRTPYQIPRATRLTDEEQLRVCARHEQGQSLRALAADFSVSHETIRAVIRRNAA